MKRAASLLCGCAAACASASGSRAPAPVEPQWPQYIVTLDEAPIYPDVGIDLEIGRIAPRVQIEPTARWDGAGIIGVHVPGAMEVWGATQTRVLGAMVCKAGALPGAPVYAARGDLLDLIAPAPGEVVVRARVQLRAAGGEQKFELRVPVGILCAVPPEGGVEPPGTPVSVRPGLPVSLLEKPGGGKTVHILPASELGWVVRKLGVSGEHSHVLLGEGPYLDGWVRTASIEEGAGGLAASASPGEIPLALRDGAWPGGEPLQRVLAGTDVRLGAQRLARLRQAGWARVKRREGGNVQVVVAVDDTVRVEGLVSTASVAAP